jgi:hypothetical protein
MDWVSELAAPFVLGLRVIASSNNKPLGLLILQDTNCDNAQPAESQEVYRQKLQCAYHRTHSESVGQSCIGVQKSAGTNSASLENAILLRHSLSLCEATLLVR